MSLLFAMAIGVLFGSGAYLVLKSDLFRTVAGIVLISNAANLALMASGLQRGDAPIRPLGERTADPLVQAMTLTALVIGFSVTALLLAVALRVYQTHRSVDLDDLSRHEARVGAEERAEFEEPWDEEYSP